MPTVIGSGLNAQYFYPAVAKGSPLLKLNPNFASINCSATFNADSYYDAFHLSVNHNFSKNFQVIASYAYGKSIDTASSTASTSSGTGYAYAIGNPQPMLPRINRGRSDYDLRNVAAISAVADVPKNNFNNKILSVAANGWELTAIYKVQSGTPFTVTLTGDETYSNPASPTTTYLGETETDTTGATVGERPNVVKGCKITNPGSVQKYLNTACFTYPSQTASLAGTPGTYLGNEQRNSISAPGYQDIDIGFIRNDSFTSRFKGQFRLELFNAVNHPNFGAPSVTSGVAATAVSSFNGQILSTNGNIPRQIQYGYKVTF
jgi:hypothetical protein